MAFEADERIIEDIRRRELKRLPVDPDFACQGIRQGKAR
jgi:hypothetical protein